MGRPKLSIDHVKKFIESIKKATVPPQKSEIINILNGAIDEIQRLTDQLRQAHKISGDLRDEVAEVRAEIDSAALDSPGGRKKPAFKTPEIAAGGSSSAAYPTMSMDDPVQGTGPAVARSISVSDISKMTPDNAASAIFGDDPNVSSVLVTLEGEDESWSDDDDPE